MTSVYLNMKSATCRPTPHVLAQWSQCWLVTSYCGQCNYYVGGLHVLDNCHGFLLAIASMMWWCDLLVELSVNNTSTEDDFATTIPVAIATALNGKWEKSRPRGVTPQRSSWQSREMAVASKVVNYRLGQSPFNVIWAGSVQLHIKN